MVGPRILRRLLLRRHALDRELQVLAVGVEDFRNAGTVVEDAAERRRAGPVVEHAAGGMRKRRGVDLPPSRFGRSDGHQSRDAETENDAPAHATALRVTTLGGHMTSESADIKPAFVQISARLA